MSSWRAASIALGLAWLCGPASVRAYSDPQSYPLPVSEGGGGGRWFTGSAADGYGCNVCHDASGSLDLSITGWPAESGYAPTQPSELTLSWPRTVEHVALVLEVVDDAGMRAGTLQLPSFEASTPDERCMREGSEGMTAGALYEADDGRQFATVIDCGTHAARVLWTPPAIATGRVWLSGGLVSADDDASAEGDVSVMFRNPSQPAGTARAAVDWTSNAGCQLSPRPGRGSSTALLVEAAIVLALCAVRARPKGGVR